jgi:photosystem II stability/assembly factor-like uncharacterized protein
VGFLAVDPSSSDRVFATLSDLTFPGICAIEKSTDGGASWRGVYSCPIDAFVSVVVFDPRDPSIIYAGLEGSSETYVVKSVDGGETWSPSGLGITQQVASLVVDPTDSRILYALAIGAGGVFKSVDAGATWRPSSSGLPDASVRSLALAASQPETLYASTPVGVFRSLDGAATWAQVSSESLGVVVIDPANSLLLYSAGNGIEKSIDGGSTWRGVNQGLVATLISDLTALEPGHLLALSGVRLFETLDSGGSWNPVPYSFPNGSAIVRLLMDPSDRSTVYAGTENDSVQKSTDGGHSWSPVGMGLPAGEAVSPLALDAAGRLWAAARLQLFRLDAGGAWHESVVTFPPVHVSTLVGDPEDPQLVYCGSYGAGVFRSTDGGGTWNPSPLFLNVLQLVLDPADRHTLFAVGDFGVGSGIRQSRDGGDTWSVLDKGLPSAVGSLTADPANRGMFYATTDQGVFRSTNGGFGWLPFNNGLSFAGAVHSAFRLAIEPGSRRLHVGSADGGVRDYEILPGATLPAVASLHGANGTDFHSDIHLFNLSATEVAAVTARYRCFSGDCGAAVQTFTLAPRELRTFRDAVASLFAAPESGGATEFESDVPIAVKSRLYTPATPAPTTGMFVPGRHAEGGHASQVMLGLSHSDNLASGSRTNLGVFNPGDQNQDVVFRFFHPDGSPIGGFSRLLEPRQALQVNDAEIAGALGLTGDLPSYYAILEGDSIQPLHGYAAVIDNRSQDPFFVPGGDGRIAMTSDTGPPSFVTIPAAASLHGRNGAYFHSEVFVWNPSLFTADIDFQYHCLACGDVQKTVSLAPLEMRAFEDIATSLFDSPESGGAVTLDCQRRIVVTSRLYTPDRSAPTVGMFVPGLEAGEATLSALLMSLSHSADPARGFRTNIGFFNISDSDQSLLLQLFDGSGETLGETSVSLRAHQAYQINDIFLSLGVDRDVPDAFALIRGDGVNPFFVYAAVIDNQSQDPIFIPGQPDPEQLLLR